MQAYNGTLKSSSPIAVTLPFLVAEGRNTAIDAAGIARRMAALANELCGVQRLPEADKTEANTPLEDIANSLAATNISFKGIVSVLERLESTLLRRDEPVTAREY